METSVSTPLLCELVAFLIASVVKTEDEWQAWGQPFLTRMYEAQFGVEDASLRLQQLQNQFTPMIGHGLSLWLESATSSSLPPHTTAEDSEKEGSESKKAHDVEEDYLMITTVEERFAKLLQPSLTSTASSNVVTDNELNQQITSFLTKFIEHSQTHQYYDARGRTIAKKICSLLQVSAMEFSQLEQLSLHNTGDKVNFFHSFQQTSSQIPKQSLVISYKLWRVAFIAAGGGAMVGMASIAAAPTIMATIVPILTSAVNVMQVSVAMETFLAYVGVMSYSVLPTAFTTYGATVASRKMLTRYGELKQFELLPLHISWSTTSLTSATSSSSSGSSSNQAVDHSAPIYILVAGHMEKNVDPRALWGANGTVLLLEEDDDQEEVKDQEKEVQEGGNTTEVPPKVRRQLSKEDLQEEITAEVHELADLMKDHMQHAALISNEEQQPQRTVKKEVSDDWAELQVKHQGWWRDLVPHGEEYILLWESEVLANLNESFIQMFKDSLYAKLFGSFKESIWRLTPIYPIKQAISLPKWALGKLKELDDAWVVAMDRAQQAGKLLAKTLLAQRQQDPQHRSVNLIGYGMGARVIFHCLEHLAHVGGSVEAGRGIVENVVLMGAPIGTSYTAWHQARLMVANRFVNAYSRLDCLLALLYRSRSLEFGVAGLSPVHISSSSAAKYYDTKVKAKQDWTSIFITKVQVMVQKELQHVLPSSQSTATSHSNNNGAGEVEVELTMSSTPPTPPQQAASSSSSPQDVEEERLRLSLQQCQDIENIDVTEIVYSHSEYPVVLPTILKMINLQ